MDNQMTPANEDGRPSGLSVPTGSVSEPSAKLWAAMQLKADMFDYLCWLEDYCAFRQAALDGKAGDYLVLAADGTTCWGKTYAEAVRVAMEHDKEMFDATSSPNDKAQPRPCDGVLAGGLCDNIHDDREWGDDDIMDEHLNDGGSPCS